MPTTTRQPTTWPAGVIARYLTLAAEITGDPTTTVDIEETERGFTATCRGCGSPHRNPIINSASGVTPWAQGHAEKCRAMARPNA